MNASDITDKDSLEKWLKTRPQADSVNIAHRAALRVLPIWEAELPVDWVRKKGLTVLPLLRCILAAEVTGGFATSDLVSACDSATAFVLDNVKHSTASALSAIAASNSAITSSIQIPEVYGSAIDTIESADDAARNFAYRTIGSASAVKAAMWVEVIADIAALNRNGEGHLTPLWSTDPPEWFLLSERKMLEAFAASEHGSWSFWGRWWAAKRSGNTLNPELERDIALLPNADWEKGPEHIAGLIAAIEGRYDLKAQVQALRQQLTFAQTDAANVIHRSHNQPPELVEDAAQVQRQITIIFDTLDEAEEELSKPTPVPSRLKAIGAALLAAGIAIAKYSGRVGDKAMMAAAATFGAGAGGYALTLLVQYADDIRTLGQLIRDYASKLP